MITKANIEVDEFLSQSTVEVRATVRLASSVRISRLAINVERSMGEAVRSAHRKVASDVFAYMYNDIHRELRGALREIGTIFLDPISTEGRQMESIRLRLQQLANKVDPSLFQ